MPAYSTENWSDRRRTKTTLSTGWTATRTWMVTDAASEDEAEAATPLPGSSNLPIAKVGDSHPLSTSLKVVRLTPERTGPRTWTVRAEYEVPQTGAPTGGGSPLLEPTTLYVEDLTWTEEADRDALGNAISNSAGVPFDPPPPVDKYGDVFTFERNEPYFDLAISKATRGRVNADDGSLAGVDFKARQLLCKSIRPVGGIVPNSAYVRVRYVFWLRDDVERPWDGRYVDQSTHGWDATGSRHLPFYDGEREVTRPVLLRGNGTPLDSALRLWDRTTTRTTIPPSIRTLPQGVIAENRTRSGNADTGSLLIYPMRLTFNPATLGLSFA